MLHKLLFVFGCFATSTVHAQQLEWVYNFGCDDNVVSNDLVHDAQHNVYCVGTFKNTVDFDPGPGVYHLQSTSPGFTDAFISKLDSAGNWLWTKPIAGPTGNEGAAHIEIDWANNLYITGRFHTSADFDPDNNNVYTLNSDGTEGTFILKLDSAGEFIWAIQTGGTGSVAIADMAIDHTQNLYITGASSGSVDLDPGPGNSPGTNMGGAFIVKLNSTGNMVWARTLASGITPAAIIPDNAGNILIGGSFSGTRDFNPNVFVANNLTAGSTDGFLLRLTDAGSFSWVKQIGSGGMAEVVEDIDVDALGNLVLAGRFMGSVDADPGPGTYLLTGSPGYMYSDGFIIKLTNNGDFLWAKSVSGPTGAYFRDIDIDDQNNLYGVGMYYSYTDFDPGPGTHILQGNETMYHYFLLKLSAVGDFVWVHDLTGFSEGYAVDVDDDHSIYTLGNYINTPDFDPGPGVFYPCSTGRAFVQKLSQPFCPAPQYAVDSLLPLQCEQAGFISIHATSGTEPISYLWDTSPPTVDSSLTVTAWGIYRATLVDADGCWQTASFAVLNPVGNGGASTLTTSACGSYVFYGDTYTATGTYTRVLHNRFGCDSNVTLHLTIHPTHNTVFTQTDCESYTLNGQTYTQSGVYTQHYNNVLGCDSTVTLNLTILQSGGSQLTQTACESYTWNGQTYTQSGTYTQIFKNAQGCDSTVTLHLTIHTPTALSLTEQACESYTLNGQTYTGSGTYTQTFSNAQGCDSVLTLSLTIVQPNTSVTQNGFTLTADATGAMYQWIHCGNQSPISGATGATYLPTLNGSYAVIITQNGCSDTSACYTVAGMGISENAPATEIHLYPNPAQEQITLRVSAGWQNSELRVVNLTGQIVHTQTLVSQQTVMDVTEYACGVYWVEIVKNGKLHRQKWVKQ